MMLINHVVYWCNCSYCKYWTAPFVLNKTVDYELRSQRPSSHHKSWVNKCFPLALASEREDELLRIGCCSVDGNSGR